MADEPLLIHGGNIVRSHRLKLPSSQIIVLSATMSNYKPQVKRNAYVTWDADKHEDILIVFVNYFKPTIAQWDDIHGMLKDMGHVYTRGCLRLVPFTVS